MVGWPCRRHDPADVNLGSDFPKSVRCLFLSLPVKAPGQDAGVCVGWSSGHCISSVWHQDYQRYYAHFALCPVLLFSSFSPSLLCLFAVFVLSLPPCLFLQGFLSHSHLDCLSMSHMQTHTYACSLRHLGCKESCSLGMGENRGLQHCGLYQLATRKGSAGSDEVQDFFKITLKNISSIVSMTIVVE